MNKSICTAAILALILVGCGDSGGGNGGGPPVTGANGRGGNGNGAAGATKYDASKATAQITGKVVWGGATVQALPYNMVSNASCSGAHTGPVMQEKTVVDSTSKGIQHAVVYVSKGQERYTFDKSSNTHTINQRGCIYVPHTVAAQVGDTFSLISEDTETHNIHMVGNKKLADLNKSIRQGGKITYIADKVQEKGAQLKCDVHGWMFCNVHVFSHPFFAITAADGSFSISVPPGDYTVKVYHENQKGKGKWKWAPDQSEASVKAEDGKKAAVTFTYNKKKK